MCTSTEVWALRVLLSIVAQIRDIMHSEGNQHNVPPVRLWGLRHVLDQVLTCHNRVTLEVVNLASCVLLTGTSCAQMRDIYSIGVVVYTACSVFVPSGCTN